jgi:hypothetical protein
MSDDGGLRDQAISNLKAKRGFWNYLFVVIGLTIVFLIIWAVTGMGYFWPMWPIAGMAIALVFSAIGTFGPGRSGPSEDQIQAEMRKLGN